MKMPPSAVVRRHSPGEKHWYPPGQVLAMVKGHVCSLHWPRSHTRSSGQSLGPMHVDAGVHRHVHEGQCP